MGDRGDSLMTVHLLAKAGHSSFLQQTLDRLLEWICPDIRLFFVSERIAPQKYYERYRKRSCGFPGISVLLFLHEDLGEERIFQVYDLLQRPPWRYQCAQTARGQSPPRALADQDFYGLDEQMPVWGIRRVHCGPEILRVTLYCSFDNYDDAVGLYEMILRKEAAVQKNNFCLFVLYASEAVAVQLCLKQLPAGVAAEPKESAALQFKVQEIGQLVPLLPHPCIPISSTRWQTQDYEGNKILLQVRDSPRQSETCAGLPSQRSSGAGTERPQGSLPAPLPVVRGSPEQRGWRARALGLKTKSQHSAAPAAEQAGSDLHRHCCSSWSTAAAPPRWDVPSRHTRVSGGLQESRAPRLPVETNVDTGLAVGSPAGGPCPLRRFPRDLRSLLQPPELDAAGVALPAPASTWPSSLAAKRKGAGQRALGFRLQTPRVSPGVRPEEEEEEFFI
uniref:Family with sequence similarity 124 member B n=1 Tax=Anas platyrhynchos TaxID=8839 RepID=A0A8B9SPD3_ANAPL